jgi:hypothetical protein
MFLSIRHKPHMRDAIRCTVIDKDTGEPIPRVIWANDETGRYRQYLADDNGKVIVDLERGKVRSKIFTGNIELRIQE